MMDSQLEERINKLVARTDELRKRQSLIEQKYVEQTEEELRRKKRAAYFDKMLRDLSAFYNDARTATYPTRKEMINKLDETINKYKEIKTDDI